MRNTIIASLALVALLGLAGCQTYEVDVRLHPDGGGTRSLVLEVDGALGAESTPTLEQYRAYFDLGADWAYDDAVETEHIEAKDIFKTKRERTRFTSDTEVLSAAGWEKLGGDVSIRGSLDEGPYAAVRFANRIAVERGGPAGARTITYTETFGWTALREVLARRQVETFLRFLRATHPALAETQLAELRGIVAAGFLVAIEMNLRDVEDEEVEAVMDVLEGYTREQLGLGPELPGADVLRTAFREALIDPDNRLETFLKEQLPGVDLAALTDLELRVTMPGEILETNADEVDGNTAVWRVEVFDALIAPIAARARARLPD